MQVVYSGGSGAETEKAALETSIRSYLGGNDTTASIGFYVRNVEFQDLMIRYMKVIFAIRASDTFTLPTDDELRSCMATIEENAQFKASHQDVAKMKQLLTGEGTAGVYEYVFEYPPHATEDLEMSLREAGHRLDAIEAADQKHYLGVVYRPTIASRSGVPHNAVDACERAQNERWSRHKTK